MIMGGASGRVSFCIINTGKGEDMATKLKNLKVTKVDFVDQGANPDAHIMLFKSRNGGSGTKDGDPVSKGGESGTEGAESGTEPSGSGDRGNVLKRLFEAIAKAVTMRPEDLDSAVEQIEKSGAEIFSETMSRRKNQKIADEIWDVCYALQASLCSILWDEELDSADASAAMGESIDEFHKVVKDSVSQWTAGKAVGITKNAGEVTAMELEAMKAVHKRLSETIEKASAVPGEEEPVNKENQKGEVDMGKIDKSRLTEAERAFLEDIEKRCAAEEPGTGEEPGSVEKKTSAGDGTKQEGAGKQEEDAVAKALQALGLGTVTQQAEVHEDIYKGLHPALKAEFEALRKFREDTEEKELREVAKSYEIIGKKEEELYPVLKSVKAAGTEAYGQLITVLDGVKAAVEKSGVFSEIGKSGHSAPGMMPPVQLAATSAETRIEGIAKGYMEKEPAMSYLDAVAKAWEDNPDLLAEYDTEAGF